MLQAEVQHTSFSSFHCNKKYSEELKIQNTVSPQLFIKHSHLRGGSQVICFNLFNSFEIILISPTDCTCKYLGDSLQKLLLNGVPLAMCGVYLLI